MLLDKNLIEKINLFENITKTKVKDLIEKEDKLIFILDYGEIIKIIVKKGKNIKTAENLMHKKIKVVEFNQDPLKFIKNFIYPIKPLSIDLKENIAGIKVEDRKSKGLLIGRDGKNLDELNNIAKRYYNLQVRIL
ncbi:MAG: NusA-like transcription termination signal-binding factor [Nanoarchaeota archaeon]